jgi:hypothetical protein
MWCKLYFSVDHQTRGQTLFTMSIGFAKHRTKFVYYFPRGHNLILQPQLQAVKLVNKVI